MDPRIKDAVWLFLLGGAYRLALLFLFPALYGGDCVGRLFSRESIYFWHWLPLTQSLIVAAFAVTGNIFAARTAVALAASLAALGMYLFVYNLAGRRTAWIGAALFTLCPLYVYLSAVPYQEVLFLGLLLGSLPLVFGSGWRRRAGFLLFGLSCLTRYEAWLALPWLFALGLLQERQFPRLRSSLAWAAGLLWGPSLWLLLNHLHWGKATAFLFHRQGAVYAWQPHWSPSEAAAYGLQMVLWILQYGTPLVLLSILGLYALATKKLWNRPLAALALLTATVLVFLLFVSGPEFITAHRFASIPLSLVLVLTALGLAQLEQVLSRSRWMKPRGWKWVYAAGLAGLMLYSAIPVARASRHPEAAIPYRIARYLADHLKADEKALMLARGFPDSPQALPMPYQRTAAQLNGGRKQLLTDLSGSFSDLDRASRFLSREKIRYVILFGDYDVWRPSDRILRGLLSKSQPEKVLAPADSISVFRLD